MDATKYTTGIRVKEFGHPGILIVLSGEFDLHDLERLRKALNAALESGSPVAVNLSGVTFLDARCAGELVERSRLYGRLKLRDPSWQARASFRARGLEGRPHPNEEHLGALVLAT